MEIPPELSNYSNVDPSPKIGHGSFDHHEVSNYDLMAAALGLTCNLCLDRINNIIAINAITAAKEQ